MSGSQLTAGWPATEGAGAGAGRFPLVKGLAAFEPMDKDTRQHINEARRQGVEWKSAIPVTDPEARLGGEAPRRGRRR